MIQLGRLEGFYWVSKTGGYAAAARAFPYPITQPAVYQQVRKLEDEIDSKLFERVGRGTMRLTPAGRMLFDFIAPFFERLPATIRALRSDRYGGTIRIHSASKVIETIIPAWITAMLADRPDIELELHECAQPDPELLRRSETDLLVDYVPKPYPTDMKLRQVAWTRGFLVVPQSHPLSSKPDLSLADLKHGKFVAYHKHLEQYALQSRALELYGIAPRHVAYLDQAEAILAMVAAGMGFSLLPSFAPEGPAREGVRSVPLEIDAARFPIMAMWRKDGPHNPLIDVILDYAPRP